METTADLRSYSSQYMAAKHEIASGHKDTGLRRLFALRHRLTQATSEDGELQKFQKTLENTIALWGEGFDWE
jgi:phage terminase Nu1 subunit (DNA packaging protein)